MLAVRKWEPDEIAIAALTGMVKREAPTSQSLLDRMLKRSAVPETVVPEPSAPGLLAAALDELVLTSEWRAIPYLAWLLKHAGSRTAALKAISALMPEGPLELLTLERATREFGPAPPKWWPNDIPFPWPRRLDDVEAVALVRTAAEDVRSLGFLSFNSNGRTREAAVRSLALSRNGRELPFLLLRVNDWVPQVARTASRASLERARLGNEEAFVDCLALVAVLREQSRSDHGALIGQVEGLLTESTDGRVALLARWNAGDRHSRRARASLIARHLPTSETTPPEVWAMCGDDDPLVRKRGLEAVGRVASESELRDWLPRLARHHAVDVRRSTFSIAEERVPDLAGELASDLVFDRNAWLREFARQRLNQDREQLADLYRREIAKADRVEGALGGLLDVGGPADAALALPYLDSGTVRVRQAALLTLVKLAPERASMFLLQTLTSSSPRLSKTAALLSSNLRSPIPLDSLEPLLASSKPYIRRNALRVLRRRDRWCGLIGALRLRHDSDESVVEEAQAILKEWRSLPAALYVGPHPTQRMDLVGFVADLDDEPGVRRTLRAVLDRWPK